MSASFFLPPCPMRREWWLSDLISYSSHLVCSFSGKSIKNILSPILSFPIALAIPNSRISIKNCKWTWKGRSSAQLAQTKNSPSSSYNQDVCLWDTQISYNIFLFKFVSSSFHFVLCMFASASHFRCQYMHGFLFANSNKFTIYLQIEWKKPIPMIIYSRHLVMVFMHTVFYTLELA